MCGIMDLLKGEDINRESCIKLYESFNWKFNKDYHDGNLLFNDSKGKSRVVSPTNLYKHLEYIVDVSHSLGIERGKELRNEEFRNFIGIK